MEMYVNKFKGVFTPAWFSSVGSNSGSFGCEHSNQTQMQTRTTETTSSNRCQSGYKQTLIQFVCGMNINLNPLQL